MSASARKSLCYWLIIALLFSGISSVMAQSATAANLSCLEIAQGLSEGLSFKDIYTQADDASQENKKPAQNCPFCLNSIANLADQEILTNHVIQDHSYDFILNAPFLPAVFKTAKPRAPPVLS